MRTLSFAYVVAATVIGAATSFTLVEPAAAQATIAINPGNVPATAANYDHECSANLGGGPYPGKDVWVFNLPGNADTTGSFTSITATFDTDGDGKGDTTVLIDAGAADGDDIVMVGHSKAYAITKAGWTLTAATATITGEADKFVLTHTCPAPAGSTTPPTTPPTDRPTTGSPAQDTPATTPTRSSSAGAGSAGRTGGESSGSLPITGVNAAGAAALGLALIGGGAALVLRRRRRFVA
jgi:LPXTG-motif cell wall-anchored protein